NRLPAVGLTVFESHAGLDRLALGLDIAAKLSSGTPWPDGASNAASQTLVAFNDPGLPDPTSRLRAMGADFSNCTVTPTLRNKTLWSQLDVLLTDYPATGAVISGAIVPDPEHVLILARLAQRRQIALIVAVLSRIPATGSSSLFTAWGTRQDVEHPGRELLLATNLGTRSKTVPLAFKRNGDGTLRW